MIHFLTFFKKQEWFGFCEFTITWIESRMDRNDEHFSGLRRSFLCSGDRASPRRKPASFSLLTACLSVRRKEITFG
jgi:hypothetical protein